MRFLSGIAVVAVLSLVACQRGTARMPCGNSQCDAGQVCCLDCNGEGTCGAPGIICAGLACTTDGGPDAGALACGTGSCASNQVCCLDCDGTGTCLPPGSGCPGYNCDCGTEGQRCCGNEVGTCTPGLLCCTGIPYPPQGQCATSCPLESDVSRKTGIAPVDVQSVLKAVAALPIATWQYKSDPTATRHMGPMAQDFYAAFAVGSSDVRIEPVDANGVLLAAVQALARNVEQLRGENAALRARTEAVQQEIGRLTPQPQCTQAP
ncbi:MAG: tail fiber domain-containing protein [Myxococcaceae bacterium]